MFAAKQKHVNCEIIGLVFKLFYKKTLQGISVVDIFNIIQDNYSREQHCDIEDSIKSLPLLDVLKTIILKYRETRVDIEWEHEMNIAEQEN